MSKEEDLETALVQLLRDSGKQFRTDLEHAGLEEHKREAIATAIRAQREVAERPRPFAWLVDLGATRIAAGFASGFACILIGWFLPQIMMTTTQDEAVQMASVSRYEAEYDGLSLAIELEDLEAAVESFSDSENSEMQYTDSAQAGSYVYDDSVTFGGFDLGYEALVITAEDLEDNGVMEEDEDEMYST